MLHGLWCNYDGAMTTTTVSSEDQIVIPKSVRERRRIKPGMRLYITEDERGLPSESTRPGKQSDLSSVVLNRFFAPELGSVPCALGIPA